MIRMNENYNQLQRNYLFAEIADRVKKYTAANPDKASRVLKLGIGDVNQPLVPAVITALHQGVNDMADAKTFQGYRSDAGYEFLRQAILETDFKTRGVDLDINEIFISTGAKEDTANFQEILSEDSVVAVQDPVYPVYVDSNVMGGRSGGFDSSVGQYRNFVYLPSTIENDFKPTLPSERADVIYLCYPNNPTGQVLTKAELKQWVDYARENDALILFDAAYEAFIRDEDVPHSIFEIEGAKEVAVEFRSLSKTAGFTGTRLAYTVVPQELKAFDTKGKEYSLNQLWSRRQATKFNGVAYIIQKGASAVFTDEGQKQTGELIDYYLENARLIGEGISSLGLPYSGGKNSPYIWFKAPDGWSSWDLFDTLLNKIQVVGTPGEGFGKSGAGYFRLSAFGNRETVVEAIDRIKSLSL